MQHYTNSPHKTFLFRSLIPSPPKNHQGQRNTCTAVVLLGLLSEIDQFNAAPLTRSKITCKLPYCQGFAQLKLQKCSGTCTVLTAQWIFK